VEAGLVTILVLSGVTAVEDIKRYPYRPDFVFRSVAEIGL
jgi:NagD protein